MPAPRRSLAWTVAVALVCVILLFPFYWMFVTAVLPTSKVLARDTDRLTFLTAVLHAGR